MYERPVRKAIAHLLPPLSANTSARAQEEMKHDAPHAQQHEFSPAAATFATYDDEARGSGRRRSGNEVNKRGGAQMSRAGRVGPLELHSHGAQGLLLCSYS